MNTHIACIRLGRVHVITVTCPEVGQELLVRQDNIFSSRPVHMSTEISTYGYLTVALTPNGEQWKKMKRIVTSEVLSTQRHRWLQDKRMEETDNLTRWVYNLCNNDEGGIVKVRSVAQHYCGNVIRKLMLNIRCFGKGMVNGGPGQEEIEHVDSLFKILGYINTFSISDYLPWLRRFDLDGHEKILRNALESIKKYNDPIIDERIEMWRVKKEITREAQDILDVLIQLTDESSTGAPLLTSSEIKAQILDLMLAAVDNPSHATEWALAEMINEPKLLQRAIEELDEVVGRDRLVQESDLPNLNYIKACAREAFRLHPVSAFNVPHLSTKDTNVAGYYIPKGSHVFISRTSLGRNPKIWEEPLKFKPERHLNPDGSQVVLSDPKLGLLSFSTGRRGCPGVLLGSTMTTMLLATLLHGFTWTAPQPMVSSSISLAEAEHDLTLSKPLVSLAKPRLPMNVYPMP
ncbi:Cytochrome p450 [Thalictrum thalictroides]|uniref:Cytochrome p450 n=1 Tax=Thalictrum thalictroides TaxID=46969 RepID=A0A7J6W7J7_THATH|nr:Cytochrome p450 [Thalictrum thalictroides]